MGWRPNEQTTEQSGVEQKRDADPHLYDHDNEQKRPEQCRLSSEVLQVACATRVEATTMTIRSRFLTVLVLVTVLMGFVGACSWVILERIQHDFTQFVDDTVPILRTLERVRLGGLRIVASTSEFGFILAEKAYVTDTADIAYGEVDERTLIDEGTQLYTQEMERYTDLIARSSPENVERLGRIRQAARRLQATSHAIISLKQQGRTGEEVLQLSTRPKVI